MEEFGHATLECVNSRIFLTSRWYRFTTLCVSIRTLCVGVPEMTSLNETRPAASDRSDRGATRSGFAARLRTKRPRSRTRTRCTKRWSRHCSLKTRQARRCSAGEYCKPAKRFPVFERSVRPVRAPYGKLRDLPAGLKPSNNIPRPNPPPLNPHLQKKRLQQKRPW